MCGLIYVGPSVSTKGVQKIDYSEFCDSFIASSRRGQDSSGLCVSILNNQKLRTINIFKINSSSRDLLNSKEFKAFLRDHPFDRWEFCIGHTRMNTDGNSYDPSNNQPLVSGVDTLVLNGIIVNANEFMENRDCNDGYSLFGYQANDADLSGHEGIINLIKFDGANEEIQIYSRNNNLFVSNTDRCLVVSEPTFTSFSSNVISEKIHRLEKASKTIIDEQTINSKKTPVIVGGVNYQTKNPGFEKKFIEIKDFFDMVLVRCKRCVLPSTHPFISFDQNGVCNFCNNYRPRPLRPVKEFEKRLCSLGGQNVLLGLSGGRDSCLALHELVTKYDRKPITYTYDWGVNTELSRRNVSRMCGNLKVENVLISADLRKKRRNVRLNLQAWFKRPVLGILPLMMAGDKQFISNAALLKQERKISAEIFAFNLHEKTQFKEELTGIKMWSDNGNSYGEELPISKQLALLWFYGKEAFLNPRLLNVSVIDSLKGFVNYYHSDVDILQFFEFHSWNERDLEYTLSSNYGWEFAQDTPTSWRIGDGTAAFYNLAYYFQLGFTENDVIRSNLIRAGQITRDEALKMVENENSPRLPTLEWYCKILELDFDHVLEQLLRTHSNVR